MTNKPKISNRNSITAENRCIPEFQTFERYIFKYLSSILKSSNFTLFNFMTNSYRRIWVKNKYFYFLILNFLITTVNGQSIRNLVIEGAGIRGIAYAGAMIKLDSLHMLDSVENVAGSSAGAIQAMLIAVGYPNKQMPEVLLSKSFSELNDGSMFFIGGSQRLLNKFGWYKGEALRKWIEQLQFKETGIRNLTFFQLDSLKQAQPNKYKNLYINVSNLSLQKADVLSVRSTPQMPISLAVSASCSIPLYYQPVLVNQNYTSLTEAEPGYYTDEDTFLLCDGGLTANYPFHIFDSIGGETFGLKIENQSQMLKYETEQKTRSIQNMNDYLSAFYDITLEAQNFRNNTLAEQSGTIRINVGKFNPKVRKLSSAQVNYLLNCGSNAVQKHFVDEKMRL